MPNPDHWSFYWISFVVLFCSAAVFRPRSFAVLLPLVFFWPATVNLLIDWTMLKLVFFAFLLSTALHGWPRRISSLPYRGVWVALLLALGVWSVYGAYHVPDSGLMEIVRSAVQRPPLRGIVRTVYFLSFCLAAPIAFWGIRGSADFSKVLRVFFRTALVAALVGLAEVVAFRFVPSLNNVWLFFNVANIAQSVGDAGGAASYRPCPFVPEPYYYGYAMGFAACLGFLCRVFPVYRVPKWATGFPFIALCLFLWTASASVSAIASIPSGLIVLLYWLVRHPRIGQKSKCRYVVVAVGLIVVFVLNAQLLQYRFYRYLSRAGFGQASGITTSITETRQGAFSTNAYLYWFIDQPEYLVLGCGFGNGAFYAYNYLPHFSEFLPTGFMTARLPILDTLSDIGIVGMLSLFGLWVAWWRRSGRLRERMEDGEAAQCLEVIRGILIFVVISGLFYETYALTWFFFGAAFALTAAQAPEALEAAREVLADPASEDGGEETAGGGHGIVSW